ncbi:hypothetical protein [Streptomyces sp. HPF1205]|uniref:hypothetical protein n=1 Tax=Streptomyces sp. HPF1205 TaxID=2873262 RepID=UPI001CED5E73|nr:hypothetical protein [Streptomyces sp. HPF1205]
MTSEALHHWILVLDVERYSTRSDPVQRSLRTAMYDVFTTAFGQAGLNGHGVVTEDRGDGVLVLVPPTVSPVRLAGPFVRALDEGLREKAAYFGPRHALRLRLAMHQGLATRDEYGWSGDAVNTASRLVDAQPLRDVLHAAELGHMVFAVSSSVYEGVVRHGHRGVDPAAYAPMSFRTKHGERVGAWVTVPGYSAPPVPPPAEPGLEPGGGSDSGAGAAADAREGADRAAAPAPSPASAGPVFHIGVARGDVVGHDKNVTIHRGERR